MDPNELQLNRALQRSEQGRQRTMRHYTKLKRRQNGANGEGAEAVPAEALSPEYLQQLEERLAASESVCAIALEKRSGALFFHAATGKFTFVEKVGEEQESRVFDCVQREQWERQVMVFGHETATGGFIASGHGTLTGNKLAIRLANGHYYRFEVDPTLPHLAPFFVAPEVAKERAPAPKRNDRNERKERRNEPGNGQGNEERGGQRNEPRNDQRDGRRRNNVVPLHQSDSHFDDQDRDESEDLTEEDLRRLRGEIPMETKRKKSRR